MPHSASILDQLQATSTLAVLSNPSHTVGPETRGQIVADEFDSRQDLAGVLIVDGSELIGMISRDKFLEQLSRPFGLDLYMQRPIRALWDAVRYELAVFSDTTGIHEAARCALARPVELVYEPVIVTSAGPPVEHRLLSIYVLLLAQSKLLALANDTIREQAQAADAANRAKSQFLANMSHEIRTPMNGIIGMTELVLESTLTAEQREYLEMVRSSANSLLTVINDVLDFSKIEVGKMELERLEFGLREFLGDVMKPLGFRAHAKGLELACHVPPDVPDELIGDYGRWRQIIVNLVGNAIKFTKRGEIVVRVCNHEPPGATAELLVTVSDTGVGIPADRLSGIFEPFEQADGSTTRNYGGTGLGLAISRKLVEMMGGRIGVESELGRGTTFSFTLRLDRPKLRRTPAFAAALDRRPGPPRDLFAGRPVLIVDDNGTSRAILTEMLTNWRLRPLAVENAAKAHHFLSAAARVNQPFSLAVIDGNMPNIDGYALVRKIRSGGPIANMPLILLTSGVRPATDVGERSEKTSFVSKPVKQSDLLDAIVTSLGAAAFDAAARSGRTTPPSTEARVASVAKLNVLLAEDNLVNQTLAVRLLEKRGYEVRVVSNGQEAVEAAATSTFDLILMDVQMPILDGLEATARIRKDEQARAVRTPIVAMTAHAMRGDRERCLESGMDGYVTKPVRPGDLFAAIDAAIGVKHPAAPQAEPPAMPTPIDWNGALERTDGDRALLREIVELFVSESDAMLAEVRGALAAADAPRLRRAAHTLKGSLGYFTQGDPFQAAVRLEQMGRDGRLNGAGELLSILSRSLGALKPDLSAGWETLGPATTSRGDVVPEEAGTPAA